MSREDLMMNCSLKPFIFNILRTLLEQRDQCQLNRANPFTPAWSRPRMKRPSHHWVQGNSFPKAPLRLWLLPGNILQPIQAEWVVFPLCSCLPTVRVIFTLTVFTVLVPYYYSFYCNSFVERMNSVRAGSSHS